MIATVHAPSKSNASVVKRLLKKRFSGLSKRQSKQMLELWTLLHNSSNDERGEIEDTILEILCPEEFLAGVGDFEDGIAQEAFDKRDAYRKQVGEEIRKRRQQLHMTQEQLAAKAGIPQSHVSRLERGKHTPSELTMQRIARALKIKPSQLDPAFDE